MTTYTYQRGETVTLALDAVQGDAVAVTGVTAVLKAVTPGRSSVDAGAVVAASFAVSNRGAAGWTLSVPAATSAVLAAGTYLVDARLVVAGGVIITDPVTIRLVDAVTS